MGNWTHDQEDIKEMVQFYFENIYTTNHTPPPSMELKKHMSSTHSLMKHPLVSGNN